MMENHSREFPSLYYTVGYRLSDGTAVEIIAVDTIVLCGNLKPIKNADLLRFLAAEESSEQPVLHPSDLRRSEDHWNWLERKIRDSRFV